MDVTVAVSILNSQFSDQLLGISGLLKIVNLGLFVFTCDDLLRGSLFCRAHLTPPHIEAKLW